MCSDESRNGKTLLGRILADAFALAAPQALRIYDTDFPNGSLAAYFPQSTRITDFRKTTEHVGMLDTIIAEPDYNYVIDLDASLLEAFFRIYHDIGFEQGAREAGISISIYFLLDRRLSSVEAAARISAVTKGAAFVPVINEAVGNILLVPQGAKAFEALRKTRQIVLPRLSIDALNLIDDPAFSFAELVARNGEGVPLELKVELFAFLETIYNQRRIDETGNPVTL